MALQTVDEVLRQGWVQIGELDEEFIPWQGTHEQIMERVKEALQSKDEDPYYSWRFVVVLTEKGKQEVDRITGPWVEVNGNIMRPRGLNDSIQEAKLFEWKKVPTSRFDRRWRLGNLR